MLKLQIKLFLFTVLVGGSYMGGLKFTEMKYGVDSPESLAKSDAPEFLAAMYQPFYRVRSIAANNPISAKLAELETKVKESREISMDQLKSY